MDISGARQASKAVDVNPILPIESSVPKGIYTNLTKSSWYSIHKRQDSGLGDRIVLLGLPPGWSRPVPPRGTHIFKHRAAACYMSLGESNAQYDRPGYAGAPINLHSSYFTSHFNGDLLPEGLGKSDTYTFLPFIERPEIPKVGPSQSTLSKKRAGGSTPRFDPPTSQGSHPTSRVSHQSIPSQSPYQYIAPRSPTPFLSTTYASIMVGKKSGRALQLEEGLERTDNGMKQTSWPETSMINQKNYYTEYMKRDEQILPLRLQLEASRDRMIRHARDKDRALARTGNTDVPGPLPEDNDFGGDDGVDDSNDGFDASKIIIIHPGSQYMRIGFASDALPKTMSMVAGLKASATEAEELEARPRRWDYEASPEQQFGDDFAKKYTKQCNDLKVDMRANKRKVLPNSKELVINYNRRTPPERIPEHNDPVRIEWTDVTEEPSFTGIAAQRIPDDSAPKFKLFWPIQHGWLNERDNQGMEFLSASLTFVIEEAVRNELSLDSCKLWPQYSCVFVIPDLYDKKYVEELLRIGLKELEFAKVCFIQESLAASFGAGYSTACIVDVGAQKTSICCVEDGMCIEDSRINLKYGGYDVTETFIKMMLYDHFPYQEINLMQRYDFLLAEELKIKFCTMNQAEISVQLYNFHLRAPSDYTRKYQFKTYDEVILAPMGFYEPSIFDNSSKLDCRRRLVDRSYNAYEPDVPDDPVSAAQVAILTSIKPSLGISTNLSSNGEVSTPAKEKSQPFSLLSRLDSDILGNNGTPGTSTAGSPAPEGANTPNPGTAANGHGNGGSPGPANLYQFGNGSPAPPNNMFTKSPKEIAIERDSVLPIAPLDTAIITSIQHATKGDDKKFRDLIGGIMVIGGGAKTPGFAPFLEERLKAKRPDLADKILVGASTREMDGQVVVWKGASVFGKLTATNDTWISALEYERHQSRVLHHKLAFNY